LEEIKPFEFRQCITILKATGEKARNLRTLKDRISDVSDESIAHHVYHYFQKEKRILEYTNDFAQWAGETLKENILAEQLSNIDPYSFKCIVDLRKEIVSVIDAYLKAFSKTRAALSGDEFYFNEGITLVSPVGIQVKNLAEFIDEEDDRGWGQWGGIGIIYYGASGFFMDLYNIKWFEYSKFMDEKVFYTKILGIKPPWFVKQVIMDEATQRIDIYVDHEKDIRVRCQECGEIYGMYDHAPERVYRNLKN